jgi:hypothetical protein
VFAAVFACEKQLASVQQRLSESCKHTASLQVVSSVFFFVFFAVLILGPPGGPLLLGKTLDTYSSKCPAWEKSDGCVQSALFLGRQCDCLRRLRRRHFVYDFFSFCRGECSKVGFAWVEAAVAFARFFICSLAATCNFADAPVVIEKTRFLKLFSVQCCQNAVRILGPFSGPHLWTAQTL